MPGSAARRKAYLDVQDLDEFRRVIREENEHIYRSDTALARALGYTTEQFNKWLNGATRLPYRVVLEICETLDIPPKNQIELFKQAGYPLPSWVDQQLKADVGTQIGQFLVDQSLAGEYEGESRIQEVDHGDLIPTSRKHIERFKIVANENTATIRGRSFSDSADISSAVSTWTGYLFKLDGEFGYYFGVEIHHAITEWGILYLQYEENGVDGWYCPANGEATHVYDFHARKSSVRYPLGSH